MIVSKQYFTYEIHPYGGFLVRATEKTLSGDVVGEILGIELLEILRENQPLVLAVDLTPVRMISSTVVGALLRVRRTLEEYQGELRLSGVSDLIREILRTMNLETHFRIFDDENAALDARPPRHRQARDRERDIELSD